MKYRYVQGMSDPQRAAEAEAKMRQEADTMHRRVQMRGADALRDYQSTPTDGYAEDSPVHHQRLMQRGRDLAGDFDPAAQIGVGAMELGDRARAASPPAPDGIDHIGAFAESLLRRARASRGQGG